MSKKDWTIDEKIAARQMHESGHWTLSQLAEKFGTSYDSLRHAIRTAPPDPKTQANRLLESPFPSFDKPLVMEGDALILPDVELPFHHAEFINKVLDLSEAWGIDQAILAGDLLHFHSITGFAPMWTSHGEHASNLSVELHVAREAVIRLANNFDFIDLIMGNHEGRLLRALETPLFPDEILTLLRTGNKPIWRTAPYYYSYLISEGEKFLIEHPKNYAANAARKLASIHQCHVLMGHSHRLSLEYDDSGKFYACHIGACVDERKLPYASQRHNTSPEHKLGAAIVRRGKLWLLHEDVDWDALHRAV